MPVHIRRKGGKFRTVEKDGSIAMTENGKPRDGGGFKRRIDAAVQVREINKHYRKKKRRRK